jgi:hypothetical protein
MACVHASKRKKGINKMIDLEAIYGDDESPRPMPVVMAKAVIDVGAVACVDTTSWEDAIGPPDPCRCCGSLQLWENALGQWRCLHCDPPLIAWRLLDRLEKARMRKTGSQQPPGCDAEVISDELQEAPQISI